ncbi:MAG: hypothetical protein LH610_11650 [Sphingomonas bacterium]|nr:hypothetical protein [Sphingomonas bacterium]
MMIKVRHFFTLLCLVVQLCLPVSAGEHSTRVTAGKYTVNIFKNNGPPIKIPLSHSLDGFDINCAKTHLLAWGKDRSLNKDNPRDSRISIIELQRAKVLRSIGFDRSIFGITFVEAASLFVVNTDIGEVFELRSGKRVDDKGDPEFASKFAEQECKPFNSKSYRRYSF